MSAEGVVIPSRERSVDVVPNVARVTTLVTRRRTGEWQVFDCMVQLCQPVVPAASRSCRVPLVVLEDPTAPAMTGHAANRERIRPRGLGCSRRRTADLNAREREPGGGRSGSRFPGGVARHGSGARTRRSDGAGRSTGNRSRHPLHNASPALGEGVEPGRARREPPGDAAALAQPGTSSARSKAPVRAKRGVASTHDRPRRPSLARRIAVC